MSPEAAEHVEAHARIWMNPDLTGGPTGDYQVTSLYLDRADWLLAGQTWEGVRERFKLRIRYYGPEPETIFAEVKKRVGSTIEKLRSHITDPAEAAALAHNEGMAAMDGGASVFRNLAESIDARPGLWVRYRRKAFVSPWGDGTRLTFDRFLEVQEPTEHDFLPVPQLWRTVELDEPIILELKFNGAYPAWMRRIAEGLGLRKTSCSKYAQGVETVLDGPWSTLWASDQRRSSWTLG